ncbi:hypothetical protein EDC01DRAFT_714597 [Geopyxis carbonaria]|nr:hypothetical protein EDC01DRAFT_714597 [Geopyxis carbonaria]
MLRIHSIPRSRLPHQTLAILSSSSTTSASPRSRTYATAAPTAPTSVAVLGGGITGLAAAWYLTKFAPHVPVTLYERSPRLGGWLHSKRVEYDGGSVLFEQGPRTLRPSSVNGLATLDMIRQLGIEDEMLIIPKSSPAAKNRYIYYPDRLNQLPSTPFSAASGLFTLPVLRGTASGMLHEVYAPRRPASLLDESVGSFMTRRLNARVAQNMISAVLHGIYAGDVDTLSMRSLFPRQWRDEAVHGSMLRGIMAKRQVQRAEDAAFKAEVEPANREMLERMKDASVYSFTGGIETLSQRLTEALAAAPNVTVKTDTSISALSYSPEHSNFFLTTSPSAPPTTHSHIISTLFAPHLNTLLPSHQQLPHLSALTASTVQVTNLYFATPALQRVRGFGYLLPKSLSAQQNPHAALGVIFDSDATPSDTEAGTKLTIMAGGHHWRGRTSYPSDDEAVANARELLKAHLGITEAPVATNVALQRECIPQYTVGHEDRMVEVREALEGRFGGRLAVAGSSYRGVGLNDCVRYVRDAVKGVVEGGCTGLEGMGGGEEGWVEVEKK